MPLLEGKENIGKNISRLRSEGYKPKQAIAISLRKAGIPMAAKRRKRRTGKRKHRKGHVPLHILEKRLTKLSRVVASRKGRTGGKRRRRARKK